MKKTTLTKCILLYTLNVLLYFTLVAQPKERLKNRYRESNMTYGAPYTMFDISEFKTDKSYGVAKKKEELINLIKQGSGNIYISYKVIYETYHNSPNPTPLSKIDKAYDPLATHAKNKAFIALVGVDGSGNPLPQSEITRLQNEAYSALENMNTDVLNFYYLHKTT